MVRQLPICAQRNAFAPEEIWFRMRKLPLPGAQKAQKAQNYAIHLPLFKKEKRREKGVYRQWLRICVIWAFAPGHPSHPFHSSAFRQIKRAGAHAQYDPVLSGRWPFISPRRSRTNG